MKSFDCDVQFPIFVYSLDGNEIRTPIVYDRVENRTYGSHDGGPIYDLDPSLNAGPDTDYGWHSRISDSIKTLCKRHPKRFTVSWPNSYSDYVKQQSPCEMGEHAWVENGCRRTWCSSCSAEAVVCNTSLTYIETKKGGI